MLFVASRPPDEQQHRQRRRDRQRDGERRQHGEDVGDGERPEQAAGNSGKGENRKEDQQRRKRSVDHGGADLEEGVKHDASLGPRL